VKVVAISGEHGRLRSELVSKAALHYLTSLMISCIGFAFLFVATHFIGYEEYGLIAFALSLTGIFYFITDLGFMRAHTKTVSEGRALQECLSTYLVLRLLLTSLYAIVTISVIVLGGKALFRGEDDSVILPIIAMILSYYILSSITQTFVTTLLAMRRVLPAQAIVASDAAVKLCTIAVVPMTDLGALGIALAYVMSGAISIIAAIVVARAHLPSFSMSAVNRLMIREYGRFAKPLAIASIGGVVAVYLDKVIIQMSFSSVDTGIYFAAQTLLTSFLLAIGNSVMIVAFPAVSEMMSQRGELRDIRNMVQSQLQYLAIFVIPLAMFLTFYARVILEVLLSSSSSDGALVFSILSISYTIYVFTMPLSSQILGMGMVDAYARYNYVGFSVMITLDLLLIPDNILSVGMAGLGIVGGALAILCAYVAMMILFIRKSSSMFPLTVPTRLPSVILVSVLSGVVSTLILSLVSIEDSRVSLVAAGGLFIVLFFGMALPLRAITLSDIRELLRHIRV